MEKILKLTKLFEEEVSLNLEYSGGAPLKLILKEGNLKGEITLADSLLAPNIPQVVDIDYQYEVDLAGDFFGKLKKVSSSPIDTESMTLSVHNDENGVGHVFFTVGNLASYSDKLILKYPLEKAVDEKFEYTFPLHYFDKILSTNGGSNEALLKINNEGLIYFKFSELISIENNVIQSAEYILIPQS